MKLYDINGVVIGEIYDAVEELPVNATKVSNVGIDLIKKWESFSANPYYCPAGIPTIGYGNTRYNDGTKVTMNDKPITEVEATNMLLHQVDRDYGAAVDTYTVGDTNQNQFDAMTSFCYNVGAGAYHSSTLLKKHNAGDFKGAAEEFLKWVYANGVVMQGLVNRREDEKALYELY